MRPNWSISLSCPPKSCQRQSHWKCLFSQDWLRAKECFSEEDLAASKMQSWNAEAHTIELLSIKWHALSWDVAYLSQHSAGTKEQYLKQQQQQKQEESWHHQQQKRWWDTTMILYHAQAEKRRPNARIPNVLIDHEDDDDDMPRCLTSSRPSLRLMI